MTQENKTIGEAAIWFAMDGYSTAKGVNGRRIAGESFLKGYLRHTRSKSLATYASSSNSVRAFVDLSEKMGNRRPVSGGVFDHFKLPGGKTNLYLPTPNIGGEGWRRARVQATDYSISGVTHTISTERVLRAFCELRTAPIMSWDAVICTSKAVYDSVTYQLDEFDNHLKHRFGSVPERFQLPIIPLGINTDDFVIAPKARDRWRKELEIGPKDIAVVSVARLSSFEKFDPIPMFMALQNAAKDAPGKVHLIGLGQFSDGVARKLYSEGVKRYAPDVTFHHVDGAQDQSKRQAVAAADIFSLPVDNIQETFGLSPVEAMAAGLPVVVTDWNGFRDTVTPECGFLIRTTGPTPGTMGREAERYEGKLDNYNQFIGIAAQMTVVDIKQMTDAFSALFKSADLRAKMGAAGQTRAQNHLDWKQVIPQYEDLWAELDDRRAQAGAPSPRRRNMPHVPDPTRMFANYATTQFKRTEVLRLSKPYQGMSGDELGKKIAELVNVRGLNALKRKSASMAQYHQGIQAISQLGDVGFPDLVEHLNGLRPERVERLVLWYLKYGLIELVAG